MSSAQAQAQLGSAQLRQGLYLPSKPGAAVGLAERNAETGLLVARQQRIMHSWQRQPRWVLR